MITFRVSQQELARLARRLERLKVAANDSALVALGKATLRLHKAAVQKLSQPGRGIEVVRYSPRRRHRVSLPGDPPAPDLGTLRKLTLWAVDRQKLEGRVGTTLDYGAYLEFGTVRMAARPWLLPALMESRPELASILKSELKATLEARL